MKELVIFTACFLIFLGGYLFGFSSEKKLIWILLVGLGMGIGGTVWLHKYFIRRGEEDIHKIVDWLVSEWKTSPWQWQDAISVFLFIPFQTVSYFYCLIQYNVFSKRT